MPFCAQYSRIMLAIIISPSSVTLTSLRNLNKSRRIAKASINYSFKIEKGLS